MSKAVALKGGSLIEDAETDDNKMPSRRQLLKLESNFEKLPTAEVLRRVYKRHAVGIWQLVTVITWAAVIYSWIK